MSWHRAIAIFVLLLFLPATTLAGASVRHCVGSGGHNTLEFVVPGLHHLQTHEGHNHTAPEGLVDEDRFVEVTELIECVDNPLLTESIEAANGRDHLTVPVKAAPVPAIAHGMANPERPAVRQPSPLPTYRAHPQLSSLRTIVLRN